MIKVYTLFFLLFFTIIAKSEVLAIEDSIVNPLDTIEVSLIKEGVLLPAQVYTFVQNLENFYNDVEGTSSINDYLITNDDAQVLLEQVSGEAEADNYSQEQIISNFLELSTRAFNKLNSIKNDVNQLHVFSFKSNKINPSSPAPDRNILRIAFLKDKEYVNVYQINLLLINGQIKLLHAQ
jgi:hypothetical protein